MDAYAQYARWRSTRPVGLRNRRLAAMLGDFVYETSSAEDVSRLILELLHPAGTQILSGSNLKSLELFTSEHNRDQRRAEGIGEKHVSWGRIDLLSQEIIRVLSETIARKDPEFVENNAALDRMFATTGELRRFRNMVDHRAPSDGGGKLQFYRDSDIPVTPRTIWGWTEIAACYWSNITSIVRAISMATGVETPASRVTIESSPLQWPPVGISTQGLRVIKEADVPVPQYQLSNAREEWTSLVRRWNRKRQ